ncbi:hypothetical protein [Sphingomonas sp. LaA6.9]|uniref:hypothetical protein n=1 Tax=Sphingomonas sp. LaA6.9 TaxID=2919914 RepID=UPI001F4F2C63|nr:hypothetical protein [Sphingomonas sp. LaA6.9]MCJ8159371.1 hypothetical protein [Sphingomonas sp. LaA6.9]
MHLLRRIERHLRRHEIPATRFGREAVRDPRLVHDLRNGREPGARLTARVTRYMDAVDAGVGA